MKPAYLASLLLLAASASVAQSHGVPASVTSFGFGGNPNAAPGVPASVTSLGPQGFGSECCGTRFRGPGFEPRPADGNFRHHGGSGRNGAGQGGGVFGGYFPVYAYGGFGYSAYPVADQEETVVREGGGDPDSDDPAAALERHAARRRSADEAYDRGYEEGRAAAEESRAAHEDRGARKASESKSEKPDAKSETKSDEPAPAPAVEIKTVLVYRDGHKEELSNYAIVGDQLFDFSDGKRKIAVADLDVAATVKANDQRGVDFQLPATRAKK